MLDCLVQGQEWAEAEDRVEHILIELFDKPDSLVENALALRRAAGVAQYGIDGGYIGKTNAVVDSEIIAEHLDIINWVVFRLIRYNLNEEDNPQRRRLYVQMAKNATKLVRQLHQMNWEQFKEKP